MVTMSVTIDWTLRASSVTLLAIAGLQYAAWRAVAGKLRAVRAELARASAVVERTLPPLRHMLMQEDDRLRILRSDYETWARIPASPTWRELDYIARTLPSQHCEDALREDELLRNYFECTNDARKFIVGNKPPFAGTQLRPFELALASASFAIIAFTIDALG